MAFRVVASGHVMTSTTRNLILAGIAVGGLLIVLVAIGIGILARPKQKATPSSPPTLPSATPIKPGPVRAELSKLRYTSGGFRFALSVTNTEAKATPVFAVVYGRNIAPEGKHGEWGWGLGDDGKNELSPAFVSRNWKDGHPYARFTPVLNDPESTEGSFGWDPRSVYSEVVVWLFTPDGEPVFEKKYDVRRLTRPD